MNGYIKNIGKKCYLWRQIAKICNVNCGTIRYWLIKFRISTRSLSYGEHLIQANHCNLSQRAIGWINGELLGDGSLYSQSPYSAGIRYTSKHQDYLKYFSKVLNPFGIKQSGRIYKEFNNIFNKYSYRYRSCAYVELLPIYKKWYPKDKKIVPRDLKLTPSTCRQWYIGDRNLYKTKKGKIPFVRLSTNNFPISDVNWLVKQLIKLGFKAKRQISNTIYLSTYSTKDFLDYIGECPVKCYEYKFEY